MGVPRIPCVPYGRHHLIGRLVIGLANAQGRIDLLPTVLKPLAQCLDHRCLRLADALDHRADTKFVFSARGARRRPGCCRDVLHGPVSAKPQLLLNVGESLLQLVDRVQRRRVVLEKPVEKVEGVRASCVDHLAKALEAAEVDGGVVASMRGEDATREVGKKLGCRSMLVVLLAGHADHAAPCLLKDGDEAAGPVPITRADHLEYEREAVPAVLPRFRSEHGVRAHHVAHLRELVQEHRLREGLYGADFSH
mmetsp:Transcript_10819/g.24756  ORF Transcript_10819/g.24756 Transcript_10819/m.24756 type:complete len:251 (-) Transcript_10819:1341-2093(-)